MKSRIGSTKLVERLGCLAFAILLSATVAALAHEGATGVVKERMDLMDRQKDDMKLMGDMAKGKTPFDAAKAAEAARDIETTSKRIPELFPEGSGGGESEAKDEIWTNWDEFTADAEALGDAAAALATVLEGSTEGWTQAFKEVSEACKTCHKSFRKKKER